MIAEDEEKNLQSTKNDNQRKESKCKKQTNKISKKQVIKYSKNIVIFYLKRKAI